MSTKAFRDKRLSIAPLSRGALSAALFVSVCDSAARQVIRREVHRDPVALENADVVLPHFAAHVGEHLVAVFELYAERRVGQHLGHRAHHLNRVTGHAVSWPPFGARLPAGPWS